MTQLIIHPFFHKDSSTFSYILVDALTKNCAVLDSCLDFNNASGKLSTDFADTQLNFINNNNLNLQWILETHAHADHLSASGYFRLQTGAKIAVSEHITKVQKTFKNIFNIDDVELAANGAVFNHLFKDQEIFYIGKLPVTVLETPGHTNDSISFLVDNNLFVGDTLFMPDTGTARCDFPGGSASVLFDSIQKIYQLPDETTVWMCHDYLPDSRDDYRSHILLKEMKLNNIHVTSQTAKSSFVTLREKRDLTLDAPRLLYPSVQVNIRAGQMPKPESNETSYIKIPIKDQRKK